MSSVLAVSESSQRSLVSKLLTHIPGRVLWLIKLGRFGVQYSGAGFFIGHFGTFNTLCTL